MVIAMAVKRPYALCKKEVKNCTEGSHFQGRIKREQFQGQIKGEQFVPTAVDNNQFLTISVRISLTEVSTLTTTQRQLTHLQNRDLD